MSDYDIIVLIKHFLIGKISARQFEENYFVLWKKLRDDQWEKKTVPFSSEDLALLDRIFTSVDSFCSDPVLRSENDLDEALLLEEVIKYTAKFSDDLKLKIA
jgi:hypothetical protein